MAQFLMAQLYEVTEGRVSFLLSIYSLMGYKGVILFYFFAYYVIFFLFHYPSFLGMMLADPTVPGHGDELLLL